MVRIRVRIIQHDGASKKEALWQGLHKAKAYVYKLIQAKEAFYLVTDSEQAELILKDHVRQFLREKGLEVQIPPEHSAMRTILVKGQEWYLAEKSEEDIKQKIQSDYPDWKLERVVKIPNNDKLMKFICANVRTANEIMDKGLTIYNQRFAGKSLEREMYVNITPCFRCYQYDHITKKCNAPSGYKVCSECSRPGHRFDECKSQSKKCINCGQPHKTMAFKCPVRTELVKKKIQELKQKKREKIPETEVRAAVAKQIQEDLPANYSTIIASAITLANIREQECPGTFQYITDEMYRANDLPVIKYPATVIAGYEHYATKKRGRETSEEEQVMEEEEGAVGGTIDQSKCTQSLLDLLALSRELPAPTPTPTPTPTPLSTPAQSPVRAVKEDRSTKTGTEPSKKKGKKEEDPRVTLITYKGSMFPEKKMSHTVLFSYIQKSKILKYIYRNKTFSRELVKDLIGQQKIDLANAEIFKVDKTQFDKVVMGQYMELRL